MLTSLIRQKKNCLCLDLYSQFVSISMIYGGATDVTLTYV